MSNQKLAEALRECKARLDLLIEADRHKLLDVVAANNANNALEEHDAQPQGFTVFLRQANGEGTTHISFQEEADRNAAVYAAIRECRTDWGWEDDGSDEDDDLHVLGVAAGDVTIVEWDDLT